MILDDLESETLKLPAHLRARLAEALMSSLDSRLDEKADIEQTWADEAEQRYREMGAGAVGGVPAVEVLVRARSRRG